MIKCSGRPVRFILATPEFTAIVWRQEPQYSFRRHGIIRLKNLPTIFEVLGLQKRDWSPWFEADLSLAVPANYRSDSAIACRRFYQLSFDLKRSSDESRTRSLIACRASLLLSPPCFSGENFIFYFATPKDKCFSPLPTDLVLVLSPVICQDVLVDPNSSRYPFVQKIVSFYDTRL